MESTKDRIVTKVGAWMGVYHGGPYIDIYHVRHPQNALTVINVYDYAAGEPTIPFTREAVRAKLREWLAYDEDGWREADDIVEHQLPYL